MFGSLEALAHGVGRRKIRDDIMNAALWEAGCMVMNDGLH